MLLDILKTLSERDYKLIQNNAKQILLDSSRPINPDSVAIAWTEAVIWHLKTHMTSLGLKVSRDIG
jgi:hypothetical protein